MAESTKPTSSQQTEEMYWALTLREDLRDIRNELRQIHTRIDDTSASANKRTDDLSASMSTRFETLSVRMEAQFRWMIMAMIGMTGLLAGLLTALIKL